MKRWLVRSAWLLAGGVWLWLGVGLHRELPRSLGPEVCRLPASTRGFEFAGFVGATNEAAFHDDGGKVGRRIVVVNAETGSTVRELAFPPDAHVYILREAIRRHAAAFVVLPADAPHGQPRPRLYAIDLRDGRRQFLTDMFVGPMVAQPDRPAVATKGATSGFRTYAPELTVTPDRPWVAVHGPLWDDRSIARVAVFDFRTGRRLFISEPSPEQPRGSLRFLPASDRVIFPTGPWTDVRFEVWRLGDPPTREKIFDGWVIGQYASAGANGRLASSGDRPAYAEVFSVDNGRSIFSTGDKTNASLGRPAKVLLSASGKALLADTISAVWNVDGGPPIWVAPPFQHPRIIESNELFVVEEPWHQLWDQWWPSFRFETHAFRRLDDGELLYRVHDDRLVPWPGQTNAAGTLVVTDEHTVRRLPPRVDWPLLALCQVILALPPFLLWALLRRRRRRKCSRPTPALQPTNCPAS